MQVVRDTLGVKGINSSEQLYYYKISLHSGACGVLQDRYVLASLVELTIVCFWHGAQTCIPSADDKDYIALVVIVAIFILYNVQFFIRILIGVYLPDMQCVRKTNRFVLLVRLCPNIFFPWSRVEHVVK